jgi:hypothetical protein
VEKFVNLNGFKEVYKPRSVSVLYSSVDHNGMATPFTRSDWWGSKQCHIYTAVDETDDDMVWYGSEEDGNVWSGCE